MPRPLGRDRVEPSADGSVVLLSMHPKPWTPREEPAPGRRGLPGSAVRWDDEIWEVLRIEPRAEGGFRHVLAPWDERNLVRSVVDYGSEAVAPDALAAVPPSGAGARSAWTGLPWQVRALSPAFACAVLLGWFFPFRVMGEGISFLVHELGHTAVAWLFGCTALPAIVMTIAFDQLLAAAVLIWAGIVFAAVRFRRLPRWNHALAAAAVLYPLFAFTRAYLTLFDLGGHLAEVLFAAWALPRALRRDRPAWEGHVWAFFAFYLVARNVKLFAGVALSGSARTDYLTIAITGQNDLVKVASATGLPLPALAALTALVFLAAPLAALARAALFPRGTR